MKALGPLMLAAAFGVSPLPQPEGPLEPSVQNEVDHALAQGARWLAAHPDAAAACATNGTLEAAAQGDLFATNGRTRAEIALALVSRQRGGGWWLTETNAAPTRLALEILKGL